MPYFGDANVGDVGEGRAKLSPSVHAELMTAREAQGLAR